MNAAPITDVTITEPTASPWTLTPAKARLLVVLAGLLVYCNSFTKAFVYDDFAWIHNDPHIQRPFDYVEAKLSRAVVAVSIQANFVLGRLNPLGYHFFNLAVHLLAGLTVFGLMRRTLLLPQYRERCTDAATALATSVALLWMVHPIATHCVTYIIQRCESMMGLFYLLALYCFVRGATAERGAWLWHLGCLGSAFLGALCKEVMLSIGLVVLAYEWTFLRGTWKSRVRARGLVWLCLLLIPAGLALFTRESLLTLDAEASIGFGMESLQPWTYFMTQAGVILHYLRLTILPYPLSLDYRDWQIVTSFGDFLAPGAVVGVLLLATLVALALRHWSGFVGMWFFLVLSVSSTFFPIIDVANDYRMYLPTLSIIIFAVMLGWWLLRRFVESQLIRQACGAAVVAGVATWLGWLTLQRNEDYRSEVAIWEATLQARPSNPRAMFALGTALQKVGENERARHFLDAAAKAGVLHPQLCIHLAIDHWQRGEHDEAVKMFRRALPSASRVVKPYVLASLGSALAAQGEVDEGIGMLREAIALDPLNARAISLYAGVLLECGHENKVGDSLERAMRIDPTSPQRAQGAARALMRHLKPDRPLLGKEAVFFARAAAAALGERDAESLDLLAATYAATGRIPEAVATGEKALQAAIDNGQSIWESRIRHRLGLYRVGQTTYSDESKGSQ